MKSSAGFWQSRVRCRRNILSPLFLALTVLLAAPFAGAQSTGGRIRGTISDPSGASVTAATVTLINEATHATRDVQSGASGEYVFIEVPVGSYEIDVTQAGFKKYVRKGIALDLNQVISVDITLQLGCAAESVEVTGAPPVVDTSSTQLGAVVNERSSTQLPLNQRDVYQLLQLQPGVQSQLGNDLFYGSDRAGVVTVNGGRGRSNNYTVNGGDGNDLFANLPAVEPSPDSIEEFRVISNSFDAEYGRNSGAVVNVVTKSGTNDFHGSFYEFFRNDVLNTHPFSFSPSPKPAFKQNQFGGTLGGPIKKDKTFFFASYEGRRIVQGIVSQPVTVPTAADVNGDFSGGTTFHRIAYGCYGCWCFAGPVREWFFASRESTTVARGAGSSCRSSRGWQPSSLQQHFPRRIKFPRDVLIRWHLACFSTCPELGEAPPRSSQFRIRESGAISFKSRSTMLLTTIRKLRSTTILMTTTRSIHSRNFRRKGLRWEISPAFMQRARSK